MPRATYFVDVSANGVSFKYAWHSTTEKYDTIAAAAGLTKAGNGEPGLVFGANKPKPPRVRLNFDDGTSQVIFCSPGEYFNILGGSLNGSSSNGRNILSAGAIG